MIEILLLNTISFIKTFILFMAILFCVREGFKLYKSVKLREIFTIEKRELLILAMSIAYILTLIFI